MPNNFIRSFIRLFIFLFLAALGLRCCGWTFSSCSAWTSYCSGFCCCRASAPGSRGFSSCDSRAPESGFSGHGPRDWFLRGMWNLPGSGIEPVSPALTGGLLNTGSPGKSYFTYFHSKRNNKCWHPISYNQPAALNWNSRARLHNAVGFQFLYLGTKCLWTPTICQALGYRDTDGITMNPSEELKISHFSQQTSFLFHCFT